MRTLTVVSLNDLDIVLAVCRAMFEDKGKLSVVVKPYLKNISDEQRKLYFKWMGEVGGELGHTKDEMHETYKAKYLLNIYLADADHHAKFAAMAGNLKLVKTEAPERYQAIKDYVMESVSIMDATVANMREYLNEIENNARDLGIKLTLPEMRGIMGE